MEVAPYYVVAKVCTTLFHHPFGWQNPWVITCIMHNFFFSFIFFQSKLCKFRPLGDL